MKKIRLTEVVAGSLQGVERVGEREGGAGNYSERLNSDFKL